MIGCLRTRVRKQPIIVLYFDFANELKFYNLEARNYPSVVPSQSCSKNSIPCRILVAMATIMKNFKHFLVKKYWPYFKINWYKWFTKAVEKHGRHEVGPVFLLYYIGKLLKIFVSETTRPTAFDIWFGAQSSGPLKLFLWCQKRPRPGGHMCWIKKKKKNLLSETARPTAFVFGM